MRSIPLFLLLLSAWLFDQISNRPDSQGVLQVAVYDSPPFGLQYPDGTCGGLMVELWEGLASDLNYEKVPVLKYLNNSRDHYQRLAISPWLLLKINRGMALPDNSLAREPIDQLLLEKIANPKWQKAVYRYLGKD